MSNRPADPLATIYAALRDDPNNDQLYNSLGCIYYRCGQIPKAEEAFAKAIRLSPENCESHYNLGNCYIKQELPEQAISHYLAALKLKPDHTNAQQNLAMVYVSQKRYAEAIPWLEKACAIEPEFAELQGHLAEAYLDQGKTLEAIRQYEHATLLEPKRAEWQHNLAVLYLRNQEYAKAKQRFDQALALDPTNATAKHMSDALGNNTPDLAPTEYINALFDQYAGYYNKHMREQLNYQVPTLLRQAIGQVLTVHTTQRNILDLGCGTGLCGIYFRDLARYIVGVDLSMEMLLHAQSSTAYDALCRYDLTQGFPGINQEFFDIVIAADVLVYCGDLSNIFKNIRSCLKVQGLFGFTTETPTTQDAQQPYILQKTGRFAHSADYILQCASLHGFTVLNQDQVALRSHNQETVNGTLFVLRKRV